VDLRFHGSHTPKNMAVKLVIFILVCVAMATPIEGFVSLVGASKYNIRTRIMFKNIRNTAGTARGGFWSLRYLTWKLIVQAYKLQLLLKQCIKIRHSSGENSAF